MTCGQAPDCDQGHLLAQVEHELATLLKTPELYASRHYAERQQALVLMRQLECTPGAVQSHRSEDRMHLRAANEKLYRDVRQGIRAGRLRGPKLRRYLEQFTPYRLGHASTRLMGYDLLDDLWAGVCGFGQAPEAATKSEPDMVHLEHTPARVVLALLDRWPSCDMRHFVDVGAGLGQVVLLVAALKEIKVQGIEVDATYTGFARQAAIDLGLDDVSMIACDARSANYAGVEMAFMFTPFVGPMLRQVLDRLRWQRDEGALWIASYGPSSNALAQEPWLGPGDDTPVDPFRLNLFSARSQP